MMYNFSINNILLYYRSIATPGSLKQKNEDLWLPRHYITLSLVAGAVILTSLAGYKLLKQHTNPQQVASVASKKRDYL